LSQFNLPLNSKELKIILKSDKLTDIIKDKENVLNIIKSQIQKQEGIFDDTTQDEDHRKVWYLDTKKFEINKDNNFLLRIRKEFKKDGTLKGYDVNFKNRNDDKHETLKHDLSHPIKSSNFNYKDFEFKFEEDIITPFHSKFSVSTKFEFNKQQEPKIDTWQEILNVFPNLDLGILSTESLLRVNGFMAKEFSYELGQIIFKDGNKAKTEISVWYESNEEDEDFSLQSIKNKIPVIVEFDIGIEAKESSVDNTTLSDQFPSSFLEKIKTFYMALQKNDIVDLSAKKTKTEFAYG
jgi:hypothetical protein